MKSTPEPTAEDRTPVSNLTNLHKQQRKRKGQDTTQSRGRNTQRNERGRSENTEEKVTPIYPRETTSPPLSTQRYSSTSPPVPTAHNATTSPLLSALGAARSTQYTNEWTRTIPHFTQGSPGNGGIAIAGSPPSFHNSPGAREGLYAQQAMSNSPPGMRPLSHPDRYTSFGGRLQSSPYESPSSRDRRASMHSRQQTFASNPPLPHELQPHFYGLPDLGLGLDNAGPNGIQPGENGYYCGFDTLSMAGDEAARTAENVILVGSQGALDVFRVERSKLDLLGRLEGLRGAVISAKVLPWTMRRDPLAASRPLIALILHGPLITEGRASSGSGASSVVDDSASESPSRPTSLHKGGQISGYQTTVEIYSLKEKRRVAVLYKSPLIPLISPIDSPLYQPPPSVGDFVVDAKGKFVVVASGASGEVFIFAPYQQSNVNHPEQYRCVGKVWTSVQFREKPTHSSASSAAGGNHEEAPPEKYAVPIFSLSDRWLAVTPPASSGLYPVNGVPLTSPEYERPPGLTHHTVPTQPSPNCFVDAPEAGLLDRLTREGTQVAIKGASWATQKGIQAFKQYMNKGTQPSTAGYGQDPMQNYFPPTHGHSQTQPRQETSVVSIYDLQRLIDAEETRSKNALQPIATIPSTLGCSFLSFSTSGLMLMTVSKKGDYQDVWDLKRLTFKKARRAVREQMTGPHVRQVARFTRMTIANVVDILWSAPRDDKVAIITDKGTIHTFLMPYSASQWPPPRRPRQAASNKTSEANASPGSSGAVNSAIQAINGTAKPFFDAVRTRKNSSGARFSLASFGVTPAAGAKSGKAVAAGVGKSINNIRFAGANKITLPASTSGVKPHSARWLSGRGQGLIGLVSGGTLQMWRMKMRSPGGKSNTASITKKKLAEFGLRPIYDAPFPPAVAEQFFPRPDDPETPRGIEGIWIPRVLPTAKPDARAVGITAAPLSFSEIETNPPYQPFYTDRRVTRFVYARQQPQVQTSASEYQLEVPGLVDNLHGEDDNTPWLFGDDVNAVKLSTPVGHGHDLSDDDVMAAVATRLENKMVLRDGEEEVEQIVVTTRRKRMKKEGAEEGDDGFFEDDCEVLDFAEDRV